MFSSGGVILAGLLIPVVLVVVAGLVVLVAAAISGGRRETDPNGERTVAVFLGVVNWVALFTVLFATFAIVVAITGYIHSGDAPRFQPQVSVPGGGTISGSVPRGTVTYGSLPQNVILAQASPGYNVTSAALGAGLVALAAIGVLRVYRRRLWAVIQEPSRRSGPAGPPMQVYLLATAFTAVFIAFGAGSSALYGIYRAVAPGVAGIASGAHGPGVRQLLDSAYLALGALVIFRRHHRLAFPPAPLPPAAPPPPPSPPA